MTDTAPRLLPMESDPDIEAICKEHNLRISPKFQKFLDYFNDESSPSYNNGTQSIIRAYDLDPEKQYKVAGAMASVYLKKVRLLARDYAIRKGWTGPHFAKLLYAKFVKTNQPGYYDRLAELIEMKDPEPTSPQVTNVTQNTFINMGTVEVNQFNKNFKAFLESSKGDMKNQENVVTNDS